MSPPSPPSAISRAWSLPPPLPQPWLAGVAPHFREPVPGEIQVPPPLPAPAGPASRPGTALSRPNTAARPSLIPHPYPLPLCSPGRASAPPGAYPRRSLLTPQVSAQTSPLDPAPANTALPRPRAPALRPPRLRRCQRARGLLATSRTALERAGSPCDRRGLRSSGRGVRLRSQGLRDNSRH